MLEGRRRYLFDLKKQKHYAEALTEIQSLRADGFAGPVLDVDEADTLARLNQPAAALEILERSPGPLSEYGQALLAGLLEHAGRAEEAASRFEELAGREHLSAAVARRVLTYLEKHDPERALLLARRQGADTAEGALALARLLHKSKRTDEALQIVNAALRRFPDDAMLVREQAMLQMVGLSPADQAEELKTKLAVKANRDNIQLKERLVQASRQSGDFQEARRLLLEMLEVQPENVYFRSNLAYVLRDLGEIDKALDILEEVMPFDTKRHAESAYFATCRDHGLKGRALAYVERAGQGRLWGLLKKYFPAGVRSTLENGEVHPG